MRAAGENVASAGRSRWRRPLSLAAGVVLVATTAARTIRSASAQIAGRQVASLFRGRPEQEEVCMQVPSIGFSVLAGVESATSTLI
jgi:hypothetical protein